MSVWRKLWLRWRLCVCLYYHILKTIVTREGTGAYLGAVNKGAVKNGGWWRVVAVTFGLGTKRKKIQKNKVWFFGVISKGDFWGMISGGWFLRGDFWGLTSEGDIWGWFLWVWYLRGGFRGWFLWVISLGDFKGDFCEVWVLRVISVGWLQGWFLRVKERCLIWTRCVIIC